MKAEGKRMNTIGAPRRFDLVAGLERQVRSTHELAQIVQLLISADRVIEKKGWRPTGAGNVRR